MDHISPTQGINSRGETRISLDQFSKASLVHLEKIACSQQSLQQASIPFHGKGDIRPVHCKLALDILAEMNVCIEEFGWFFYRTSYLPLVITGLRYQTLHILHGIETQTSQLVEMLDRYRSMCMTPSKHTQKQRNNIYDTFETLLQSLADISYQVRMLNDEARFHEGRLLALRREQ